MVDNKMKAAQPSAKDWIRLLKASSPHHRAVVIHSIPEHIRIDIFEELGVQQSNDWVKFCLSPVKL